MLRGRCVEDLAPDGFLVVMEAADPDMAGMQLYEYFRNEEEQVRETDVVGGRACRGDRAGRGCG